MHMTGAGMLSPSMSVRDAGDNTASLDELQPANQPATVCTAALCAEWWQAYANRPPMQQHKQG